MRTVAIVRDLPSDPGVGLLPLVAPKLPELIADRLIEAVARRQLLPGQRLIETELSEQLSVSRVPLREALRILQSQGIVTALPRRGVRLIAFDATWAHEVYDIRVALERLSSRAAATRLRAEATARARLDTAIRHIEQAVAVGDIFALNAADLALHSTIYELSASPLLQTLWAAIARHVLVLFSVETYRISDRRRIAAEHYALREVLLRGSEAEIDIEVASHVAGAAAVPADTAPLQRSTRKKERDR